MDKEVQYISWSQLQQYMNCPASWLFSRLFEADHVPSALIFGVSIHAALARYYEKHMIGEQVDTDNLFDVFEKTWEEEETGKTVKYNKDEIKEDLFNMAHTMLKHYVNTIQPGQVLSVERDVELKIDNNLVLRGVVDLIEFKDGTYFIADHKTSKIKHYNTSTLPIPQLLLYYLALKQSGVILDNMNFKLRFDVIRKLKIKGDIQSFEIPDEYLDAEYINELMNMVKGVARAMKENIVYRFKSWTCKGCQYATQCESLKLSQLIDVQAEDTIPEPVPCVATIITAAA